MDLLSVKIPVELSRRVDAAAKTRQASKSAVVREALEAYFSQQPSAVPAASCLDLARDLIGSVEGPRDLATNKKHMKGFGR